MQVHLNVFEFKFTKIYVIGIWSAKKNDKSRIRCSKILPDAVYCIIIKSNE